MRQLWGLPVLLLASGMAWGQLRSLHPGFDTFTPQQDVQLGQEAAAQVEKTLPVVKNAQIDHPNPGNRVTAVEQEIRLMPFHNYRANTGQFRQIQRVVKSIPSPAPAL